MAGSLEGHERNYLDFAVEEGLLRLRGGFTVRCISYFFVDLILVIFICKSPRPRVVFNIYRYSHETFH